MKTRNQQTDYTVTTEIGLNPVTSVEFDAADAGEPLEADFNPEEHN